MSAALSLFLVAHCSLFSFETAATFWCNAQANTTLVALRDCAYWGYGCGNKGILSFSNEAGGVAFNVLNCLDKNGFAPIHYAALGRSLDELRALLSDDAVDRFVLAPGGRNVLHCAAMTTDKDYIVSRGSLVAAENLVRQTTNMLLEAGINPEVADLEGLTPLHYAAENDNYVAAQELVSFLEKTRKEGALSAEDDRGATPLHRAAIGGSVHVTELLLKKGVSVDALTQAHETPLYFAVDFADQTESKEIFAQYLEVIKMLINAGADINVKAKDGRSPWSLAIELNNQALVGVLKRTWA